MVACSDLCSRGTLPFVARLSFRLTIMRPSIIYQGRLGGPCRMAVDQLCCGTRRCRPPTPALECEPADLASPLQAPLTSPLWWKPAPISHLQAGPRCKTAPLQTDQSISAIRNGLILRVVTIAFVHHEAESPPSITMRDSIEGIGQGYTQRATSVGWE